MGGKRWQLLHRLIYGSAIAGVIHYYWLVKSDIRDPVFYGVLVGILLLWRVAGWWAKRSAAPVARGPTQVRRAIVLCGIGCCSSPRSSPRQASRSTT